MFCGKLGGGREATLNAKGVAPAPSFASAASAAAAATLPTTEGGAVVASDVTAENDRLCFIADFSFSPPSLMRILSLSAGEPFVFRGLRMPPRELEEDGWWREGGAGVLGVEAVKESAGT